MSSGAKIILSKVRPSVPVRPACVCVCIHRPVHSITHTPTHPPAQVIDRATGPSRQSITHHRPQSPLPPPPQHITTPLPPPPQSPLSLPPSPHHNHPPHPPHHNPPYHHHHNLHHHSPHHSSCRSGTWPPSTSPTASSSARGAWPPTTWRAWARPPVRTYAYGVGTLYMNKYMGVRADACIMCVCIYIRTGSES